MKIRNRLAGNGMIDTFLHLQGNQRSCLWTEPLWGIPHNLYLPFTSVYMIALGVSPLQIGTVATVFLISQMFFALLSGPLTDKLGRRLCTLIFDVVSWSVPTFLWMCAQGYEWFLLAAVFNGCWRVTEGSWALLLIEDAPEKKLIHMYSISNIAGLLAGFVAPVAGLCVSRFSVVPTMRVLYGLACLMMTVKFVVLYFTTRETAIGIRRIAECRNVSVLSRVIGSRHLLLRMLKDRAILRAVGIFACFAAVKSINNDFWPLLITDRLGIPEANLSIFSTVKSLAMLVFYFTVVPRLRAERFRKPIFVAFILMAAMEGIMIALQGALYAPVILGVLMEALSITMLSPLISSLMALTVDREERAGMLGLSSALCMLVTSPFGILAGALSEQNRMLPMALNLFLLAVAVLLTTGLTGPHAAPLREKNE